jgi:hypothetical protein
MPWLGGVAHRAICSHANVSGLDLVFYRDGFTYHTDRDTPAVMVPGSLQVRSGFFASAAVCFACSPRRVRFLCPLLTAPPQHMGGNVLGVVRALAADALPDAHAAQPPRAQRAVYADVLGRAMLVLPQWQMELVRVPPPPPVFGSRADAGHRRR